MKKPLLIILFFLFLIGFSFFIANELSNNPDPDIPILRKEIVSSWIPLIKQYYLYDFNGKKYKVSKKVYDSYSLPSYNENMPVAGKALKDLHGQENNLAQEEQKKATCEETVKQMDQIQQRANKQLDEYLRKQRRAGYTK